MTQPPAFPPTRPDTQDRPARVPSGSRVAAAIVAAVALAVLVTAASLTADPRGVETHTQLGLWPCGWYLATGRPCPTCGMTTAFAHATHGRLGASLATQPFAAALALATSTVFWGGVHVAVFGSRLGSLGDRLLRPRAIMLVAALFVAAWVYKIAAMAG
jgi:hypothetical protein